MEAANSQLWCKVWAVKVLQRCVTSSGELAKGPFRLTRSAFDDVICTPLQGAHVVRKTMKPYDMLS